MSTAIEFISTEDRPATAGPTNPLSGVLYRVGGRLYPLRVESRCHTCTHPQRKEIEEAILKGVSYGNIVESLGEDSGLTPGRIREHVARKHMPIEAAIEQAIIQHGAEERSVDYEGFSHEVVDEITFNKVMLNKVFRDMQSGELRPTISDGIQSSRVLHEVKLARGEQVDSRKMFEALQRIMELAKRAMTSDQFISFIDELRTDQTVMGMLGYGTPEPIEVREVTAGS